MDDYAVGTCILLVLLQLLAVVLAAHVDPQDREQGAKRKHRDEPEIQQMMKQFLLNQSAEHHVLLGILVAVHFLFSTF